MIDPKTNTGVETYSVSVGKKCGGITTPRYGEKLLSPPYNKDERRRITDRNHFSSEALVDRPADGLLVS